MSDAPKIVDGLALSAAHRKLLRPCEAMKDGEGRAHVLPRFFYEIQTWADAKEMQLTPNFTFAELMTVDCREADLLLNTFPHYVPCAVWIFAQILQAFRDKVGAPVFVATNGCYRSSAHAHTTGSPHHWGCAANIYRIGDTFLDEQKSIEKYAKTAQSLAPAIGVKPFGHGADESDDHLHLDIGFVNYTPRECDEAR